MRVLGVAAEQERPNKAVVPFSHKANVGSRPTVGKGREMAETALSEALPSPRTSVIRRSFQYPFCACFLRPH